MIGFVGGRIKRDNLVHTEVQLAARLRGDYPAGVYAEAFENRRGEQAREEILRLLDTNDNGKLSVEEKRNARIIIYGHSWGASETITLARELQAASIPVLLTIQVDSVSKGGEDDAIIPANVRQGINFYQLTGLLHGLSKIHAADAAHTQILGNFRFYYAKNSVNCDQYPWFARVFMKPHIEIENDPRVWDRVESLIRSKLPPVPHQPVVASAN